MLTMKYHLNQDSSSKDSPKISQSSIPLKEQSHNLSPSIISDTSPVYLFCTSKNGINSKNENGWTPIYRSIIANNLIALNELLKMGSDPNIGNNLGETPLYLCVDVDNYDALIILLQYNADTNISKRNGTTPLHLAAKKNKENYISALLRNNANPNLQNKLYSQTPTHLALINKVNEDMLNIFMEHGADIYGIKDKYDKSPFDYAKELKDDDYVNLIIKIFGENKITDKKTKTFNVNKIPEEISKQTDKNLNLNINNKFHNSGFNMFPEKLNNIYSGEDLKKEDFKLENNEESNKSKKMGVLTSGDAIYSDRSISNNEESIKSKTDNNNNIIIENKEKLSEFQPEVKVNENNNEIKQKNSLTKILKNNINIDTNMIDNSKDIIISNNNNNDNTLEKNNENEIKENKEEEIININKEDLNIKEENKISNSNNDRELIKNIISSTVKKIKVNTNTLTSEFSSNNNSNNPSSKMDYVKMINFSSEGDNKNSGSNNNITNLDNFIQTKNNEIDNGTSPFILCNNQKRHENEIEIKPIKDMNKNINNDNNIINASSTEIINQKNDMNEITPISNSKMNNHSGNSNIFSETTQINALINIPNNNMTQTEEEISNININNNFHEITNKIKEENTNEKMDINSVNDNNFYDASLEYSKSKSYIGNEINNNNINNMSNTNNIINQHHRQISYHNNSNKRKKEDTNNITSNNDLEENIIDKENENPNNNEIIYYNKNYLAGNNTPKSNKKQNEVIIKQKNEVIKKASIKNRAHSDINANDISNIHRYNSITNKTNTLNQKIFTYTSPNINKNTYLINTKLNFENNNENNNNMILNTNPNINISNLNETKDDFFSGNNNNLSSFLNTNKPNVILRDSKNDNSTFNVYDDVNEVKNQGRKTETIATNFHTINNNKNDKKLKNNEKNLKTNFRASSMGNTTLSSGVKNPFGTGKKSNNSIYNTGRNSNTNISNNMIKNIPVNILVRLRDWLISCDLLSYYNLLIENNMYDIDQIINDIKSNTISLGYKEIEDLGIRKPGHIFRLLLKLEIDSGNLDNTLFNKIISKFTISCSLSNNIILTSSVSDIRCCGICNKNFGYNNYVKRTNWPYNDIFSFLKFKDLWNYKENFLHNGFDQLEYVLLQLFSKYKFNKNILNDCLHIYSEKDKNFVLNKLFEEKMSIAKECGIDCDENENKENENNNQMLYNFSYSSSKKKSLYSEHTQKASETNLFCNIF